MRSLTDADDARAECATCEQPKPRTLGYAVVDVDGKPVVTRSGSVERDLEHARKAAAAWNRAGRKVTVAALVEVPDARQ